MWISVNPITAPKPAQPPKQPTHVDNQVCLDARKYLEEQTKIIEGLLCLIKESNNRDLQERSVEVIRKARNNKYEGKCKSKKDVEHIENIK